MISPFGIFSCCYFFHNHLLIGLLKNIKELRVEFSHTSTDSQTKFYVQIRSMFLWLKVLKGFFSAKKKRHKNVCEGMLTHVKRRLFYPSPFCKRQEWKNVSVKQIPRLLINSLSAKKVPMQEAERSGVHKAKIEIERGRKEKKLKVKYVSQSKPQHWLIEPKSRAFICFYSISASSMKMRRKRGAREWSGSRNLKGI